MYPYCVYISKVIDNSLYLIYYYAYSSHPVIYKAHSKNIK